MTPVSAEPSVEEIRRRHDTMWGRLRTVAAGHGWDPDRLHIVGVTKTHPVALVRAAERAGLTRLGESRIQEAEAKVRAVPGVEWHFIGRLQSNKVRRAVSAFAVIHSIDTTELLARVDRIAGEEGRSPVVLLEVNVTGERTKAGMAPDALERVTLPRHARLAGLMTIGRMDAPPEEARGAFARLRVLRDRLAHRLGVDLPELSMGMSGDAEAAAAEGATLVRIGTALFGPRV